MDAKKKNVSLRMSQSDVDKVRTISDRLGVRESDVMRFAVKHMLTRLAPFQDASYQGVDLMPALLDVGEDLVRFFDLSGEQLETIINGGAERRSIDLDDLKLLALFSINGEYARLKLNTDTNTDVPDEAGFKAYFMNKYFSAESAKAEKKTGEWTPFINNSGHRLLMSKTA